MKLQAEEIPGIAVESVSISYIAIEEPSDTGE